MVWEPVAVAGVPAPPARAQRLALELPSYEAIPAPGIKYAISGFRSTSFALESGVLYGAAFRFDPRGDGRAGAASTGAPNAIDSSSPGSYNSSRLAPPLLFRVGRGE